MMLMTMIAAGPDDADDAVEAALQLRFVEFGDPARRASAIARSPRRGAACAPPWSAAPRYRPARPTACRHGGRARRICVQTAVAADVAIMSTRMRSVVVSVDAAAEQDAEIAAEQSGAVDRSSSSRITRQPRQRGHERGATLRPAAAAASRPRSARSRDRQHRVGIGAQECPTDSGTAEHDRIELGAEVAAARWRIAAARTAGRTAARRRPRAARRPDSASRRRACGAAPRSARARRPSTSRTWSSEPEASPTRTSATYIGGNSAGCRDSASAKLSPADDARPDVGDDRTQPPDIGVGGEQFERVIEPRAGLAAAARDRA